jgi:L-serine dehydratase
MSSSTSISVFDVIGLVMVGPSSSHTAGAVRLGMIGRTLLGVQPEEALIELHGSFAETGRGHGTDKAIIGGLLGLDPADGRIRFSFALAEQMGMRYRFVDVDLGEEVHPNTARITLTVGGQSLTYIGSSTGGGMIAITEVQDFAVDFTGEYDTLMLITVDNPGTISVVTNWLRELNINVAFFRVARQRRGGDAVMIIETDQPVPGEVVERFARLPWVRWVRKIARIDHA